MKKYQNQVERALAVRRQLSAKAGGGMGCGQLPAELGVYVLFPLQVGSQPLGGAFKSGFTQFIPAQHLSGFYLHLSLAA